MRRALVIMLLLAGCAVAAIPEQTAWELKHCDGATTGFAFSFTIQAAADLKVLLVNTSTTPYTVTTLARPANYSLAVTNGRYPATGGTVTTVATYAATYDLVITTDIALTETGTLRSAIWNPAVVQAMIYKSRLIDNELQRKLSQAIRNPEALGVSPTTELPQRGSAGYLYRDATGNVSLVDMAGAGSGATISTYWEAVVDDASLADSLASMGFTADIQALFTDATPVMTFGGGKITANGQIDSAQDTSPITDAQTEAGLRIGTAATRVLLGTDAASGVGYLQTVQPGVSWTNRELRLQPVGGALAVGGSVNAAATMKFYEATANGSNAVTLSGPASTADVTINIPAAAGTMAVSVASPLTLSATGGVAFDMTAMGSGTWGNGANFTWIFDPAGVDPSLIFTSGQVGIDNANFRVLSGTVESGLDSFTSGHFIAHQGGVIDLYDAGDDTFAHIGPTYNGTTTFEIHGTPALTNATSPGALELYEGSGGGTNKVTMAPPAAMGSDYTASNGSLVIDDGANWRVTLTIKAGLVVNVATAASSGQAATWTPD